MRDSHKKDSALAMNRKENSWEALSKLGITRPRIQNSFKYRHSFLSCSPIVWEEETLTNNQQKKQQQIILYYCQFEIISGIATRDILSAKKFVVAGRLPKMLIYTFSYCDSTVCTQWKIVRSDYDDFRKILHSTYKYL